MILMSTTTKAESRFAGVALQDAPDRAISGKIQKSNSPDGLSQLAEPPLPASPVRCSRASGNNPSRNHEQSMGIWINEPIFQDPASIERAVGTLADSGFGIVRLFLRNSNFTHRSPEMVDVVERAVRAAHARGLRATLDCEPHLIVGRDMGRDYPDAMGCKLVRVEGTVTDGHWVLSIDTPQGLGTVPIFEGIEAAWLESGGLPRKVDLAFSACCEVRHYKNGEIHRDSSYAEELPISERKVIELRGELEGVEEGTLVAFIRFASHTLPDFWAEGFRLYFDDLLECYRHIPLDGIGWDEPAIDGDWNSYRYGRAFAQAFESMNGYRLADKLNLLGADDMTGEAVRVRLDYYRTLNEGVARAQSALIAKSRELFGPDLLFGTHHTWQGEGGINDYRAGAVDYFRLNDEMDAGYTDCCWWDQASVAYAYVLGSSLGRLTPSGEAEVNTWHTTPTVANIRSNVNLMSLMNINWFNIWFGSDTDTAMQDGHYSWPQSIAAMRAHRDLQLAIAGKVPVVDIGRGSADATIPASPMRTRRFASIPAGSLSIARLRWILWTAGSLRKAGSRQTGSSTASGPTVFWSCPTRWSCPARRLMFAWHLRRRVDGWCLSAPR